MLLHYKYEPGLVSDRLRTRFLVSEDKYWWADFFKSAEATRFLAFYIEGSFEDRAQHMIDKQISRYEENRFGLQVLIEKSNGHAVGLCGLLVQEVEGITEVEIGYHLLPAYWKKGFATEAAILFKNYAFQHKLADSVISLIDINNFPSQAVATRNGMVREQQIRYVEKDIFVYRIYPS